jgi:hypothetical protein
VCVPLTERLLPSARNMPMVRMFVHAALLVWAILTISSNDLAATGASW